MAHLPINLLALPLAGGGAFLLLLVRLDLGGLVPTLLPGLVPALLARFVPAFLPRLVPAFLLWHLKPKFKKLNSVSKIKLNINSNIL
jgi:hypothetical protein